MSSDSRSLVGVFVLVFAVTVGAVVVGSIGLDMVGEQPEVEEDHWNLDAVAPEGAETGGEIAMDSFEAENTVVVHVPPSVPAGGGIVMPIEDDTDLDEASVGSIGGAERDISPLASTLAENGHEVVFYQDEFEDGPLDETLAEADGFISTGVGMLSGEETDAVEEFADSGGRVVLTANPGSAGPATDVGSSFGLYADSGYVYDMAENDHNYLSVFVEPADGSPLADGVDRAVFRGAAPVGASDGSGTFETSDSAQISTTRETGSYTVAATSGDVALVGDSSFMSPENAKRADNNVLVGNVADYLVTGGPVTMDLDDDDEPDPGPAPPGDPDDDVDVEPIQP